MWYQSLIKKGDRTIITSNYRPVSLTSVVRKMLESIIARNIRDHLEKHRLINESHHAFTQGQSILTIFSFYRKVYQAVDTPVSRVVVTGVSVGLLLPPPVIDMIVSMEHSPYNLLL